MPHSTPSLTLPTSARASSSSPVPSMPPTPPSDGLPPAAVPMSLAVVSASADDRALVMALLVDCDLPWLDLARARGCSVYENGDTWSECLPALANGLGSGAVPGRDGLVGAEFGGKRGLAAPGGNDGTGGAAWGNDTCTTPRAGGADEAASSLASMLFL